MRDDKTKKIGSATYLNRSNGIYIPFDVVMGEANCSLIQPMLIKSFQIISYIDKDKRT